MKQKLICLLLLLLGLYMIPIGGVEKVDDAANTSASAVDANSSIVLDYYNAVDDDISSDI